MPFSIFKRRADTAADEPQLDLPTLQRQARQRLIGAVILVVIAVITFPLLFDAKPRAVSLDIPIDIPDKRTTKPLQVPNSVSVHAGQASSEPPTAPDPKAAASPAQSAAAIAVKDSLNDKERVVTDKAPAPQAGATAAADPKPGADGALADKAAAEKAKADQAKAEKSAAEKAAKERAAKEQAAKEQAAKEQAAKEQAAAKAAAEQARAADAARAQALLDGKSVPAASGRFVVQFGSFEDAAKSREVRLKVEKLGLKTYAQVAETPAGKRTRVRVGPFATRAEAEKAAAKIKELGLPANILEL